MATQEIERLIVSLEASTKKYENALAKAQGVTKSKLRQMERDAEDFSTRFSRKLGSVGASLKGFGAGFIGGLGVESIARAAATAIKSIADIGDQAKKLGLSNSEFQTLKLGAQLAGVEVEALAGGMKKLGINSSDAVRGQGEFGAILKANNISLTDANGQMRSQVEVLGIVANLVANAANEQDGLAIAQAALGKSGTELMGLLEQGAQGVEAAMRQAKDAGVQFTDEQIAKAQQYDDKIDVLIETISVWLKKAFIETAPFAESFFAASVKEAETLIGVLQYAGDKIKELQGLTVTGPGKSNIDFGASSSGFVVKPNDAGALLGSVDKRIGAGTTAMPNKGLEAAQAKAAREAEAAAKRAAAEAKRRREQIQGTIEDLKFEGAQLKRNSLQQQIQTELRKAEVSATSAQGQQIIALVTANYALEASQKSQKENAELNKKTFDEIHADRIAQARELVEKELEAQQAMRDSVIAFAEIGVSAIDSIAIQGEKAGEVLKGMVKQLASAALQATLLGQGPLAGIFGGSKGGIFGALLGGLTGGGVSAGIYHNGGMVGNGGPSRSVSPSTFANAPRYHSGGVAGLKSGEVPAILQKGEIVIPRGGGKSGGGNVFAPVIYAQGADAAALKRVESQLYQMNRDMNKRVIGAVGRERNLNPGFAT